MKVKEITHSNLSSQEEPSQHLLKRIKHWLNRRVNKDVDEELQDILENRDEPEEPLSPQEKELIASALKFGDIDADNISVPRSEIISVNLKDNFKTVLNTFIKSKHSRLPICSDGLDKIAGFVILKDVVAYVDKQKEFSLSKVLRKCTFIPDTMEIPQVLAQMKQDKTSIVVVVDEYGGTQGILTIKDILEELIGEMEDESDSSNENKVKAMLKGGYSIDPRLEISKLEDELSGMLVVAESEEYDTLGGFILNHFGRVPEQGETIELANNVVLKITKADDRKIVRVLVSVDNKI